MCRNPDEKVCNQRDGREWIVSFPDEVHATLTGEAITATSGILFAPKPQEIRRMLRALRREQRWSQAFAASVLGVTESAVVKWEAGKRDPNGAAAKLIFLLYSL